MQNILAAFVERLVEARLEFLLACSATSVHILALVSKALVFYGAYMMISTGQ